MGDTDSFLEYRMRIGHLASESVSDAWGLTEPRQRCKRRCVLTSLQEYFITVFADLSRVERRVMAHELE